MTSLNWPLGSRRVNAPFVSMGPGAMPTNRRPYRPHSAASDLVIAATPALAAADGTTKPDPARRDHKVRGGAVDAGRGGRWQGAVAASPESAYVVVICRNTPPLPAAIRRLPTSNVTFAVPASGTS